MAGQKPMLPTRPDYNDSALALGELLSHNLTSRGERGL